MIEHGPRRSYFLSIDELFQPVLRRWMLKPYIREGAIGLVWGRTEQGKTFVMADVGCSVATGTQWCGLRTVDGPVVIVAAEGDYDIKERIRAWSLYHDVQPAMFHNRLFVLDAPVSLVKPAPTTRGGDTQSLTDAINSLPVAPVLILIDPLNFCMAGADEDGSPDLTEVYAGLKRLQDAVAARFGVSRPTILLVHHTGKRGTDPRGSYASESSADVTFYIELDPAGRVVFYHRKHRSTRREASLVFRLVEQQIGQDEDRDPYTSCIALFEGFGPTIPPGQQRWKKVKPKTVIGHAARVVAAFDKQLVLTFGALKQATGLNAGPLGAALKHLGDRVLKLPGREGYTLQVTGNSNN